MPTSIQGFRPGPVIQATVRAFETGNVVFGFPVQMNACGSAVKTMRYRSLGAPVRVITYFGEPRVNAFTLNVNPGQITHTEVDEAGLIQMGACEQPVFYYAGTPDANLVDVVVEYVEWRAAP